MTEEYFEQMGWLETEVEPYTEDELIELQRKYSDEQGLKAMRIMFNDRLRAMEEEWNG
jgi:hypothetical protein